MTKTNQLSYVDYYQMFTLSAFIFPFLYSQKYNPAAFLSIDWPSESKRQKKRQAAMKVSTV